MTRSGAARRDPCTGVSSGRRSAGSLWCIGQSLLLLACAGCSPAPDPGPPAPAPSGVRARAQVLLFWGGGAPQHWRGELSLAQSGEGGVDWMWLMDHEPGDLFLSGGGVPAPDQRLPVGWVPSRPADFRTEPRPPANGATIEGDTIGEADGLCFEWAGDVATRVVLRFGDLGPSIGAATLEASMGDLLKSPRVVRVGDSGNYLVARALDLDRPHPPGRRHFGEPVRRVSLHSHSCFSTNEMALEPVVESLVPFVDDVWWTDHVPGEERIVVAGDFEDRGAAERFWRASVADAELIEGRVQDAEPPRAGSIYGLRAKASADSSGEARAWISLVEGAGWQHLSLDSDPILRWSWRSPGKPSGGRGIPFVEAELNSGRRIRYLGGRLDASHPGEDILLDAPLDRWRTVERNLLADALQLRPDGDHDGLLHLTFGVLCPGDEVGHVLFDDLELEVSGPSERLADQRALLERLGGARSHVGFEQSSWFAKNDYAGLLPHLTVLLPHAEAGPLVDYDRAPSFQERRDYVRAVHDAGGGVGAHHLRLELHYEALLDGNGLDVDWMEFGGGRQQAPHYATPEEREARDANGYAAFTEDEVEPLLVRWDRMTARGLFLTGCGAPDLHQRFDRPSYGTMNRWLSWTLGETEDPARQIRALRSGRVSSGEWFSDAVLSLSVDGRPATGKLLATDRGTHVLSARVSGAVPGSRLAWIRGALAADVGARRGEELAPTARVAETRCSAEVFESELEVEVGAGAFWRAELRNPAGHLVALSNPVVLIPYWPRTWPAGRVAFDWAGVFVAGEEGVFLTGAQLDDEGTLTLTGESAITPAGELVLGGMGERGLDAVQGTGGWVATQEQRGPGESALVLAGIPEGPFTVRLGLGADGAVAQEQVSWGPVARGDTARMPRRKELFSSARVGVPETDSLLGLEGFGLRYDGVLPLHYRRIGRGPARFTLRLPTGERLWLRLRRLGFSSAAGSLSLAGEFLGRFERMSAMTFEIPAQPGPEGESLERVFTLQLDPPEAGQMGWLEGLSLTDIELWRGSGVVDY